MKRTGSFNGYVIFLTVLFILLALAGCTTNNAPVSNSAINSSESSGVAGAVSEEDNPISSNLPKSASAPDLTPYPTPAAAPSDYFVYEIRDDVVKIIEYIGTDTDVVIHEKIDGCPVKIIGIDAFSGCEGLISVTIPEGVTIINWGAFSGCENLVNIVLPDSLKWIKSNAFYYCESLTDITLPTNVTEIGENAFSGCKNLTSIVIPASVTEIGKSAFSACSSLQSVYFEGSVPNIAVEELYFPLFGSEADDFTVYFDPNTEGWTSPKWRGYLAEANTSALTTQEMETGASTVLNVYGNTSGNIANKGVAAIQGNRIFYSDSGFSTSKGIYAVNTNGGDRQKLSDDMAMYINVVGDRIYFRNNSDSGSLYVMKTDGSGIRQLTDGEAHHVNVVDDRIYYCDDYYGGNLYTMNINGGDKQLLTNDIADSINVVGNRIYYSNYNDNQNLYVMDLNGGSKQKLSDERSTNNINIVSDWLFYCAVNFDKSPYPTELYIIKIKGEISDNNIKWPDDGYSLYIGKTPTSGSVCILGLYSDFTVILARFGGSSPGEKLYNSIAQIINRDSPEGVSVGTFTIAGEDISLTTTKSDRNERVFIVSNGTIINSETIEFSTLHIYDSAEFDVLFTYVGTVKQGVFISKDL